MILVKTHLIRRAADYDGSHYCCDRQKYGQDCSSKGMLGYYRPFWPLKFRTYLFSLTTLRRQKAFQILHQIKQVKLGNQKEQYKPWDALVFQTWTHCNIILKRMNIVSLLFRRGNSSWACCKGWIKFAWGESWVSNQRENFWTIKYFFLWY